MACQWVTLDADTKGDIYEGILEKNAEDTKSGAGQYFTPRALIKAMVDCMRARARQDHRRPRLRHRRILPLRLRLSRETPAPPTTHRRRFLKNKTFHGNEIVAGTRRLCLMNLFLHNIGEIDGDSLISPTDALIAQPPQTFDYVLANPPFGKKSSMTFTNEEGEQEKDDLTYNRQDFWATTSNKQLNFLQHIRTMLKTTGQRRRRPARQRPVRRRRRRNRAQEAHGDHRPPHHPPPAHRHLLRPGREGQRPLLRQPRRRQGRRDQGSLVLRLPHQHPPHPQTQPAAASRTSREFIDCYNPATATSARRPGTPRRTPRAAGANSPTRNSPPATRPASISSGSRTTPSPTSTTSPNPTTSPTRSSKTSKPDWPVSAPLRQA